MKGDSQQKTTSIALETGDLPIPMDYFNGSHAQGLILPDNIILFIRRNRTYLCRKTFESRLHHRFVLIINNGTSGSMNVDGYTFRFHPNQAFLVAPFQFHFYFDLEKEDLDWIFITFEMAERDAWKTLTGAPVSIGSEELQSVSRMLQLYRKILEKPDPFTRHFLVLELARLLSQLGRISMKSEVRTIWHDFIEKINAELERRLEEGIDIPQLAKKLNLSEVHLRRKFKKLTGLTLGNYLVHYKLDRAIKLIVNTRLSQTDIASICGYRSLAAFSRSFKNTLGVCPSQYRKTGI